MKAIMGFWLGCLSRIFFTLPICSFSFNCSLLTMFKTWNCCYFFCSRHPEVKWAERADKVFITVLLPDSKNAKVNLEPEGAFTLSANAGADNNLYELKLDLYDKVNVEVRFRCLVISESRMKVSCFLGFSSLRWWWLVNCVVSIVLLIRCLYMMMIMMSVWYFWIMTVMIGGRYQQYNAADSLF